MRDLEWKHTCVCFCHVTWAAEEPPCVIRSQWLSGLYFCVLAWVYTWRLWKLNNMWVESHEKSSGFSGLTPDPFSVSVCPRQSETPAFSNPLRPLSSSSSLPLSSPPPLDKRVTAPPTCRFLPHLTWMGGSPHLLHLPTALRAPQHWDKPAWENFTLIAHFRN